MGIMARANSNQIQAAGYVVFRREAGGGLSYLLLRATKHGEWGFPKGHADPGEDDRATARRETREECGLDIPTGHPWFLVEITYRVRKGPKTVIYFGAEAPPGDVVLSREHDRSAWLPYHKASPLLPHENSRKVLDRAAVFFKDPALRDRRPLADARALLVRHVGADAPVVAHSAQVAAMAHDLALGWGFGGSGSSGSGSGSGADVAAACGWLHDIGRARTHDARHPLEGFLIASAEGWAGWAAPCLSHYVKGRDFEEFADGELGTAMFLACDLLTFTPLEKCVALADFLAAGARRVSMETRFDDLVARYGPSRFLDRSLEVSRELAAEWEAASGENLYDTLRIS